MKRSECHTEDEFFDHAVDVQEAIGDLIQAMERLQYLEAGPCREVAESVEEWVEGVVHDLSLSPGLSAESHDDILDIMSGVVACTPREGQEP